KVVRCCGYFLEISFTACSRATRVVDPNLDPARQTIFIQTNFNISGVSFPGLRSYLPGDNIEIIREFIKWIRLKSICASYLDSQGVVGLANWLCAMGNSRS